MSKHYGRARTPTSPSISSSFRNSNHTTKSYNINSSKSSYSSKDYSDRNIGKYDKEDKYGQYDKYDKYGKYDSYDEKYDKYSKPEKQNHYDKIEKHSHYEKSDRNSRYDKFEKSDYKQPYTPSKEYGDVYFSPKKAKTTEKFEREDRLLPSSYKPKGSNYPISSYSDRESYSTKYSSRNNDNYPPKYTSQDLRDEANDKYSNRSNVSRYSDNGKKYDPSYSSKNSSIPKYGNLDSSYYDSHSGDFDSYGSYHNKSVVGGTKLHNEGRDYAESSMRISGKAYSQEEFSSNSDSYQRYVIGDSVVYGSPGHNPEDLYPISPKLKRKSGTSNRSLSPTRHVGSSTSKSFSRYSPSSPKRFKGSSDKLSHGSIRSSYTERTKSPIATSSRSSFRKPLSPLPRRSSLSPQGYSQNNKSNKNFSSDPQRTKDTRYAYPKMERDFNNHSRSKSNDGRSRTLFNRMRDRPYNDSGKPNRRPMMRNSDNQDFRGGSFRRGSFSVRNRFMGGNLLPRASSPPRPLLSIPLTESSLPKSSRDRYRETISHADNVRPTLPLRDRERGGLARRRFDSRMRPFQSNMGGRNVLGLRKRPMSPRDKRRRRPDDLRLWIESRKFESSKRNSSPSGRMGGRSLLTKQSTGGKEVPASLRMRALLESKKRLMAKNRARGLPLKKAPLKKPRRPISSSRKSREKEGSSQGDKRPKEDFSHKKVASHHKREASSRDYYKREGSAGLKDVPPHRERSSRDRKGSASESSSHRSKMDALETKSKTKSKAAGGSLSSSKKSVKRSSHKMTSGSGKLVLKRKSAKVSSSSRKAESSDKLGKTSSKRSSSSKDGEYTKRSTKKDASFGKQEKFLDMDM